MMRSISLRWALSLFTLFSFTCVPARVVADDAPVNNVTVNDLLATAIEDYERGLSVQERSERMSAFRSAATGFQTAIDQFKSQGVVPGADLWNALGNASLESEQIGAAILAYRKALAVAPASQTALQNLAFARARVSAGFLTERQPLLTDSLFFWRSAISQAQQYSAAALLFAVAGLLLAMAIVFRIRVLSYAAILPVVLWGLVFLAAITASTGSDRMAVVLGDTQLRSADSEMSQPRLGEPLPDGAEVRLLQVRDQWAEVEVRGQSGWVPVSQIGLVADNS